MSWPDWTSLIVGIGIGFYGALRRSTSPASSPKTPEATASQILPVAPMPPIAAGTNPGIHAEMAEVAANSLDAEKDAASADASADAQDADPSNVEPSNIDQVQNTSPPNADTSALAAAYHLAKQWGAFQAGFLARTAHELRSPMSSAIGLHQMILNDLCDDLEEERQCVADANQAAQRMVNLLDRLIEVSKFNSGAIEPDFQVVALSLILDDVEGLTYLQAANRNIGLDFEEPPEVDVWVDSKRMRQALALVVDGLITQLAQIGDKGPITLRTSVIEQTVQIQIQTTCALETWSDPIDLMDLGMSVAHSVADLRAMAAHSQLSPMMGLWVAQLAIESMDGQLTATSSENGMELLCTVSLA